jgi:hypothetical protein
MMPFEKETPASHSVASAFNKRQWLQEYAPLLVTSGTIKRENPMLREIVIEGNAIVSMQMKRLPKPAPQPVHAGLPGHEELDWLPILLGIMMG